MGSSAGARILLVVGFLSAWIGYDAWIVSHVVLDPDSTRAAAHALLDAPAVRRSLADQVTTEIFRQLPAAASDPRVGPAVTTAIRDPRVEAAFADTITRIHEAILTDSGTNTFTIDGRALTKALHDAVAPSDPQLAAQILQAPPLDVNIAPKNLPHAHDARPTADVITVLATLAALLLITASLLLRHDRRSIARIGRRTAYLAVMPLVVFVLLPRVLTHASGDAPQIASALLRVYGNRVLPSAIAFVVVGVGIVVGAFAWPRRSTDFGRSGPGPASPFNGPPPRPPVAPDRPEITERLYL
jgi:hypothetical protein